MPRKIKNIHSIAIGINEKEARETKCPSLCSSEEDIWNAEHPSRRFELVSFKDDGINVSISLKKVDDDEHKKNIKDLAHKLAPNLNAETILEDVLSELPFGEFNDIKERLAAKPKAKVRQKRGCVKLVIGGKPGAMKELQIR